MEKIVASIIVVPAFGPSHVNASSAPVVGGGGVFGSGAQHGFRASDLHEPHAARAAHPASLQPARPWLGTSTSARRGRGRCPPDRAAAPGQRTSARYTARWRASPNTWQPPLPGSLTCAESVQLTNDSLYPNISAMARHQQRGRKAQKPARRRRHAARPVVVARDPYAGDGPLIHAILERFRQRDPRCHVGDGGPGPGSGLHALGGAVGPLEVGGTRALSGLLPGLNLVTHSSFDIAGDGEGDDDVEYSGHFPKRPNQTTAGKSASWGLPLVLSPYATMPKIVSFTRGRPAHAPLH